MPPFLFKKLNYSRGTVQRAMSVEIMSNDAQLYEKSHFKSLYKLKITQSLKMSHVAPITPI